MTDMLFTLATNIVLIGAAGLGLVAWYALGLALGIICKNTDDDHWAV